MHERLKQMMRHQGLPSMSDAGREAIAYYLEEMSDQIGSRRHFSRTMQKRFDMLDDFIHMHMALQTYLLAHFTAHQMSLLEQVVAGLARDGREPHLWKGSELLAEATKIAMQQQPGLRLTIEKMREVANKQKQQAEAKETTGE
jgi:hypothetical protein